MSVRILIGDVRDKLRELDADSVDCVVTSPPYWGLRSYLPDNSPDKAREIGLERTLGEHIDVLVDVFREVRRVMKPYAPLWLNYGDCYATAPNGRSAADTKAAKGDDRTFRDKPFSTVGPIYSPAHELGDRRGGDCKQRTHDSGSEQPRGRVVAGGTLKPKDLCMIANRLAIALQDDGWLVRAENVWGKPNGMPDSSGRFRPSSAHEKVWELSKPGPARCWQHQKSTEWVFERPAPDHIWVHRKSGEETTEPQEGKDWKRINLWLGHDSYYDPFAVRMPMEESSLNRLAQDVENQTGSERANGGRKTNGNMKAVGARQDKQRGHSRRHAGINDRWDAMTKEEQQKTGRLFRNYEPEPWRHIGFCGEVWNIAPIGFDGAHFATFPPALVEPCIAAGCVAGGHVLDPFGGAGTVGMVADRMGRSATLIELNPAFSDMAVKRIEGDAGMFAQVAAA